MAVAVTFSQVFENDDGYRVDVHVGTELGTEGYELNGMTPSTGWVAAYWFTPFDIGVKRRRGLVLWCTLDKAKSAIREHYARGGEKAAFERHRLQTYAPCNTCGQPMTPVWFDKDVQIADAPSGDIAGIEWLCPTHGRMGFQITNYLRLQRGHWQQVAMVTEKCSNCDSVMTPWHIGGSEESIRWSCPSLTCRKRHGFMTTESRGIYRRIPPTIRQQAGQLIAKIKRRTLL